MTALLSVPGLGQASACVAYGAHRPKPSRFIWHHILPQVCGGLTVPENLVPLDDSCHYSVHAILYALKLGHGVAPKRLGTPGQRAIALDGYTRALKAGTVANIPNEGGTHS